MDLAYTLLAPPAGLPSSSLSSLPPPLLLSHFPYLSLYNPFVTAFPSTTSPINDLVILRVQALFMTRNSQIFSWARKPTLVQVVASWNCEIGYTGKGLGASRAGSCSCFCLEKQVVRILWITNMNSSFYFLVPLSLNTSLDTHAQILSLLALLRVTTSLPLKLFSPGRTVGKCVRVITSKVVREGPESKSIRNFK